MAQLNLKLTLNKNGSITASWSKVSGAVRYSAMMRPVGESVAIYNQTNLTTTSYTSKTNLTDNKQYRVSVTAYNSSSVQLASQGETILIPLGFYQSNTSLGVPANVTATADVTSVIVSFSKVTNATGYDILFDNKAYSVTATSRIFSGLGAKTKHTYAVRAKNASKTGAYSSTKSITTKGASPAVPSGIRKSVTTNSATISFNAVSGATGYDILFNGSTYSITTTSKTFTGLTAGKAYSFQIRAKNADGTSAYSSVQTVTTAPLAPSSTSATSTANSVTVNWSAVTGAAGYIVRFNNTDYQVQASKTSNTFSGLTPKTSYTYQVCAKSADGVGAYSASKTIKTLGQPPAPPTGITATATESKVTVSFNAVSGATSYDILFNGKVYNTTSTSKDITGLNANTRYTYQVCSKNADGTGAYSSSMTVITTPKSPTTINAATTDSSVTVSFAAVSGASSYDISFDSKIYNITGTSKTFTGLMPNTTYRAWMRVRNAYGACSYYSGVKAVKTAPKPPESLTVRSDRNYINLSWSAVAGATSYDIIFAGKTYHVTGTSQSITGLNPGTRYSYQIRANNADGSSSYSAVKTVETLPYPPVVPTNIRATSTIDSVTISWSGVSGATGYDVWFDGKTYRTTTTYQSISGLSANTSFSYKVRAINAGGAGAYSNAATVTTLVKAPTIPLNVSAEAASDSVTISWDSVTDAASYDLLFNGTVYNVRNTYKTFSELSPDTEYTYQVRAKNSAGTSAYSALEKVRTLVKPPVVMTDVAAISHADSIEIMWKESEEADSYEILFDGETHTVTEAAYTAENLAPNTVHTYQVRGKNAGGFGEYSNEQSARTLLHTPANVCAEAEAKAVTIRFDPVEGAEIYEITFQGEIYTTTAAEMKFTELTPETEYFYSVCAKNEYVESEEIYAGMVTTLAVIPATPSDVTAEATIDSVIISFSPVEDATDYDIEFDGELYNVTEEENYIGAGEETVETAETAEKTEAAEVTEADCAVQSCQAAEERVMQASGKTIRKAAANRGAEASPRYILPDSGKKVCAVCGGLNPDTFHTHSVRANNASGSSAFSAKKQIQTAALQVGGFALQGKRKGSYPDGKVSYTGQDPVNALTGAFLWSYTWLEDYGKDELHFTVMYDSKRESFSKTLGKKWTYEWNYLLSEDEKNVYFTTPYGDVTPFRKNEDNSFTCADDTVTMRKNGEGFYAVKKTDGTEYLFDQSLHLNRIKENGLVFRSFETNEAGELISIKGRHGSSISLTYTDGYITKAEDVMGNAVTFTYKNKKLTAMRASDGKQMSFTYNKAGYLLTITDFTGEVYLTNHYDAKGRVIRQDTAGRGSSFAEYDEENRTTVFTDEAGDTTKYTYDETGHVTQVELAGITTYNSYHENGQLIGQIDGLGNITRMAYDEKGRMNLVTYPDGSKEEVSYNENNKPVKIINRDGTENLFTYDERNNLISAVDERGNTVSYVYDSMDNLTAYTDKSGNLWRYSYDENNHLKQAEDPEGNIYLYSHDAIGRLLSHTSPEGNTVSYQYAPTGELLQIVDADGELAFVYDENGNQTQRTDRMGNTQRLEYNEMGQVSLATDFLGNEYRFFYDERGNLVGETDPLGNNISYVYDALGNVAAVTDKNGNTTGYTFDAASQLTQVTDAAGGTVKYAYDTMGQVKAVTNPLGYQTAYEYDTMGRIIRVTDALGNEISRTYDAAGNLLTQTDAEGEVTTYTYDVENRVSTITSGAGISRFTYDALGRVIATEDVDGYKETAVYDGDGNLTGTSDKEEKHTAYTYDAVGRMTQITDPNGGKTSYAYDKNGNCIQVTDAEGNIHHYAYDANNRLKQVTDPLGQETVYAYDEIGQLIGVTDAKGGQTVFAYDANGNLVRETNPLGGVKAYTYDELNRLTTITDEEGFKQSFTYDAAGNRLSYTDANENKWDYTYDAVNRLTEITDREGGSLKVDYTKTGRISKVTDKEGAETFYDYDSLGRLVKMQDALENSVSFTYDVMGRLLTQTDANGNTTEYEYSPVGNLLRAKDAEGGITSYTYNALRQVLTRTDANGNTVSYAYDALGQVTSITDAMGEKTSFTYTANGQIATVTNAEGNVTSYGYDPNGNLTKITDPMGNEVLYEYDAINNQIKECLSGEEEPSCITLYQYDKRGCMIREIDPLLEKKSYTYDGNGNISTETDEEENVAVVRYDLNNQPVYMGYGDGKEAVLRYNRRGELVEFTDWNGTTVMERDILGRLTKVTDHNGRSTGYVYDAAGNRTGITYPDGSRVSFGYDKNNRISMITDAEEKTANYSYDPAGNLLSVAQPAGNVDYAYNANGLPLQIRYQTGDGVSLEESLTYDVTGRITAAERKGSLEGYDRSAGYAYDSLGRMVSCMEGAGSENYTYDALGNRLLKQTGAGQTVYRYDVMNRLISMTEDGVPYSYGYDRRGNLTEERRNGSLIRQYAYDAADRMVLGKNLETGEESGYTYNALDRRVKNVQKRAGVIKETDYAADYISGYRNDLMEYVAGGAATRNVHGRGYELLSRCADQNPAGKTYYHADLYGSPLMAADGEGNFKWYAERDIWGGLKERKGTGEDEWGDSLRFTAYPYDPVTGKHFAYARVYDGAQGRMYAKDPVKRGLNGYPYCDNDPADYVDPDGEFAHIAVATFGGAVFGGVSGFIGSAISQRKSGGKFSLRKALGAAAENAVIGGVKGAMISSGYGAAAMFAGDFAAGTIGNMLNRAISGEKQNLGESVWGGVTNAVSGRASGYGKIKGVTDAFKRGALNGAATSVMNDIHDMAGIGDAGRRAYGGSGYDTGGFSADIASEGVNLLKSGKNDPRSLCEPADAFSGGVGTRSTRGYRQSGSGSRSRKSRNKSRFSLKTIVKNAVFNGIRGGITNTAFYGMDKAVDAAVVGFSENRYRDSTQRRIVENESGSGTSIVSPNHGQGFSNKGYNPQSGERTFDGYVDKMVSRDAELSLYTNSEGFNNVGNIGGEFKRFGTVPKRHGIDGPHVHKPIRNVNLKTGEIRGGTFSPKKGVGVDSPKQLDVKQLYQFFFNEKYRK